MKRLWIVFAALLLITGQAQARYCTDKNWNTGKELYRKYENRYNEQVDAFNELIEYYNNFEFFSKRYNINEFARIWGEDNPKLFQSLETQKELAFAEVAKFDEVKKKVNAAIKGLDKSRRLWEKLADYCYDEDRYKDYKSGRNNMRDAISTTKAANGLIGRINKLRLVYLEEVGFINQSKDIYEQSLVAE